MKRKGTDPFRFKTGEKYMEIIIGKTAGFCFGVANAVNKTKEQLKNKRHIFCLGELVHNKQVTKELEGEGLIFIDNIKQVFLWLKRLTV